jgi:hypothetical protein
MRHVSFVFLVSRVLWRASDRIDGAWRNDVNQSMNRSGLVLPKRKPRIRWRKAFTAAKKVDELLPLRALLNDFDQREWEW